ncbi:TIM23 complex component [Ceratobasidium sp. 394]|nr:TIM23 complex component [Ceratobasidium sp. 394]
MQSTLRLRSGNATASTASLFGVRHAPACRSRIQARLSSSSTPHANEPPLSWPEYLAIRKRKRRWEMATTLPSSFLAFGAGLAYFGSIESDPTSLIFGVEPIYIYGLATVSCGGK